MIQKTLFRAMALPFFTIALLLSSCTLGGDDDTDYNKTLLEAGTAAPDFTFITDDNPDGQTLASLRGSYVLIEFWRSTCGDCRDRDETKCSRGVSLRRYKKVSVESLLSHRHFLLCAEHGANLAGESPVTGIYRQV